MNNIFGTNNPFKDYLEKEQEKWFNNKKKQIEKH